MRKVETPGDGMQESIQEIFQDTIFQNITSLKKEDSREPVREQWTTEMDTEDSNEEKQQYKTLFMNPVAISSTQK